MGHKFIIYGGTQGKLNYVTCMRLGDQKNWNCSTTPPVFCVSCSAKIFNAIRFYIYHYRWNTTIILLLNRPASTECSSSCFQSHSCLSNFSDAVQPQQLVALLNEPTIIIISLSVCARNCLGHCKVLHNLMLAVFASLQLSVCVCVVAQINYKYHLTVRNATVQYSNMQDSHCSPILFLIFRILICIDQLTPIA